LAQRLPPSISSHLLASLVWRRFCSASTNEVIAIDARSTEIEPRVRVRSAMSMSRSPLT
jgi:hypothetical protein